MINHSFIFSAPWKVELEEQPFSDQVQPHELLVEKLYTLVSAGTELACLSGNEHWFHMPSVPGYSAVSRVLQVGATVSDFKRGDIVFHYGKHSRYEILSHDELIVPVPAGIPLSGVPFARLATIAMTSLRTSTIELGDAVAVTGLGLVGNLAAQLAGLQGATVIGIDLIDNRLELANACGIDLTINSNERSAGELVHAMTNGHGVSTLIEATGVPESVEKHISLIAPYGELILLGSPRGEHHSNVTELLNYVHLVDRGCITLKGAHEWKYPLKPNSFVKHSLQRNSNIALELIRSEKLVIGPLISHVLHPLHDAQRAYEGLRNDKQHYFGVVFDWTLLHNKENKEEYDA